MWKCSRVFQALKVSPVYIKPLSLSLMRRLLHPHPWPLPYGVFLRFWEMRKTSLQILRCFSTAEHLWSQINCNREVHSCRLRWNQKTLTKLRLVRWEFNLLSSVSPIVFLMLFFFLNTGWDISVEWFHGSAGQTFLKASWTPFRTGHKTPLTPANISLLSSVCVIWLHSSHLSEHLNFFFPLAHEQLPTKMRKDKISRLTKTSVSALGKNKTKHFLKQV